MPDRCVEDVVRIELARELAAGLGEPLRQVARPAFALVELAALERAARGRRDLRRELELIVVERALALEEDEHETRSLAPRLLQRNGQQRASPGGRRRGPEPVAEAVVVPEPPGRQHLAAAGARRQRRRALAEVRREPLRELVGAGQLERRTGAAEHGRRVAAERVGSRLRDGVERLPLGQRLAQHGRDPVEAALDLRPPRALLVRLGVPEGDRRETGERLDQAQVRLLEAAGLA